MNLEEQVTQCQDENMDEQELGDFGNGLQAYFMQLDRKIQQKINRGIEAAIKIVMKKTIKFIDARIESLSND